MVQLILAIALMYVVVIAAGIWARKKSQAEGNPKGRIVRRTAR